MVQLRSQKQQREPGSRACATVYQRIKQAVELPRDTEILHLTFNQ